MDRSIWVISVVFVALAIVGIWFALSPTSVVGSAGNPDGVRAIGEALLSGGLAAFLVVVIQADARRRGG